MTFQNDETILVVFNHCEMYSNFCKIQTEGKMLLRPGRHTNDPFWGPAENLRDSRPW